MNFPPGSAVTAHGVDYVVCFVRGNWGYVRGAHGELRRLPLADLQILERRNGDRRVSR